MLTQEGKVLVRYGRHGLRTREHIVQTVQAIHAGRMAPLRLAFTSFILPPLLKAVSDTYRELIPDGDILPESGDTDEVVARVKDGECDAALVTLPIESVGLSFSIVDRERLVLCMRSDDPLAEYNQLPGVPTSPGELQQNTCIGTGIWNLKNQLQSLDVAPGFRVTTFDPILMRSLVMEGIGIAVLPLYMARQPEVRNKIVHILPTWQPKPAIHSALYFGSLILAPKIKVFLDFVGEVFGTERDPRIGGAPFEGLFGRPDGI